VLTVAGDPLKELVVGVITDTLRVSFSASRSRVRRELADIIL